MKLSRLASRFAFAATALAMLAQSGCKKAVVAPIVVSGFTMVQGNLQVAQAGTLLPVPVVLRVVDASGDAVPGVTVVFSVATGGGTVTPASILSDAHGEVSVKWTLGSSSPLQSLTASVGEGTPVSIFANAMFPSAIVAAQGNNQTAKPGQALANNIVIRVTGDNNVPLNGIPVQFQVIGGGGAISPQTALTNAFGEVTVKWTLGTALGMNSATATASTLSPVQLLATAAP
jgi:adhesin/invasin